MLMYKDKFISTVQKFVAIEAVGVSDFVDKGKGYLEKLEPF